MTRIRADKYGRGQLPYPRSSASSAAKILFFFWLWPKTALVNRDPAGSACRITSVGSPSARCPTKQLGPN
jgi:hypothetical protein